MQLLLCGNSMEGWKAQNSWYITDRCRLSPLSQDGSLEDQLVPHREVCNLQVLQQLIHDVAHVLVVAHGEEQVQASPPDADVCILQRSHNALLMPAPSSRAQLSGQCMDRFQDNVWREDRCCSAVLPMHAFQHIRANAPSRGKALVLAEMYAGNYRGVPCILGRSRLNYMPFDTQRCVAFRMLRTKVGQRCLVNSWKLVSRCLLSTPDGAELVRISCFLVCHRYTVHGVVTSHHCLITPLIRLQSSSSVAALQHKLNLANTILAEPG